eukprot:scaffold36310_cov118-Isochrysis_galbana.AAC.1
MHIPPLLLIQAVYNGGVVSELRALTTTAWVGCRRVPCRKAGLRCGRGQVRVVWRRACRERLAPGLGCCRSVGRS